MVVLLILCHFTVNVKDSQGDFVEIQYLQEKENSQRMRKSEKKATEIGSH